VSPAAEQICQDIMENVHRGVTYLEGKGGFAKERKDILFIVVRLTQVSRVKTIVDHYDPQAFMIVSDTSEVSGKGFTLECESYADARRKWQEAQEKQKELMDGHE
ncbi:MAG: YitT family protein, partial [Bacteroidales bacterium]|nr:YitT family protein [Bacteroidales bacterium]